MQGPSVLLRRQQVLFALSRSVERNSAADLMNSTKKFHRLSRASQNSLAETAGAHRCWPSSDLCSTWRLLLRFLSA